MGKMSRWTPEQRERYLKNQMKQKEMEEKKIREQKEWQEQQREKQREEKEQILRSRVSEATIGSCWICGRQQKPVLTIYDSMFREDVPTCATCGRWDFEEQEKRRVLLQERKDAGKRRKDPRKETFIKKLKQDAVIQKRKDYCRNFWYGITSMYLIYLIIVMVI